MSPIRWNFPEKWDMHEECGSALLEFAIALPLLVVLLVGIYDFSGAFIEKQKIGQAAEEGAIIAGAQPMSDLIPVSGTTSPDSLQPVLTAIINSLIGAHIVPQGSCMAAGKTTQSGVQWTFTFSDCPLVVIINRGAILPGTAKDPVVGIGSSVTVQYPYQWHFNSVISLLSGSQLNLPVNLSETAVVHNQS